MDAGTPPRRARIRLRQLSVHAVALVPDGANMRRWAEVRKDNMEGQNATTDESNKTGDAAAAPAAKVLTLPKAAQEGLTTALTQGIEALSALLDMTKSAQVTEDGAAQVPPEFAEQIERVGMMISALGDQYEPGGGMPAGEAEMALSPEQMALTKTVAKAHAVRLVSVADRVSKGRVKMSFDQMMKLHSGLLSKLYDIANELAPLIGEAPVADVLGPPPESGGTAKSAPEAKPDQPASAPPTTPTPAANDFSSHLSRLERSMQGLSEQVTRIAKARGPSNSLPANEGPRTAPEFRIPYGVNLSAEVRAEEQKKNGQQNNGAH